MPKTYSPFIELTRTDEVAGLSEVSLVNVDDIILVRCNDDGTARVYFRSEPRLSQWIDPVETYAWFVNTLTELTTAATRPTATPARKRTKKVT